MPKREQRIPKRNGRNLRVRWKEAEPHKGIHMLSREGNKMINEEIMLMQTLFLVLEVEVEGEEE